MEIHLASQALVGEAASVLELLGFQAGLELEVAEGLGDLQVKLLVLVLSRFHGAGAAEDSGAAVGVDDAEVAVGAGIQDGLELGLGLGDLGFNQEVVEEDAVVLQAGIGAAVFQANPGKGIALVVTVQLRSRRILARIAEDAQL